MQGKVQAFTTKELGTLSMNISKQEIIEVAQKENIEYTETARTVTLLSSDEDIETLAYFILSDDLSEVITADLCDLELTSITIDNLEYSIDEIRNNSEMKRSHKIWCDRKKAFIDLDNSLQCSCSAGVNRENCLGAGEMYHYIYLPESIITYIEYNGYESDNKMFCIENFHGKHVDYKKIQEEDALSNGDTV